MTGYLTPYAATAILNGTPHPATLYLLGHTDDPGPSADLFESGTGRMVVAFDTAVAGSKTTIAVATKAPALATEDWTHLSLWDGAAAGNPWWIIPLPAPFHVNETETIRLPAGAVILTLEMWS